MGINKATGKIPDRGGRMAQSCARKCRLEMLGSSWKHGRIVRLPKISLGLVPLCLWVSVCLNRCRAGCWVDPAHQPKQQVPS